VPIYPLPDEVLGPRQVARRSRRHIHLSGGDFILGEGNLAALQTAVEHAVGGGQDEIVSKARAALVPLLTLIEYSYGLPVDLSGIQVHAIEPASEVSVGVGFLKLQMTVARRAPMPPAAIVANLTESTRLQLDWYLLGQNSPSVIERINNFYKVLEHEKRLTTGCSCPYLPPAEAKHLRDAVSHPQVDNPDVVSYLQSNIGSAHIDPKNEAHTKFLELKATYLQSLAQAVLDGKVPKWW